MANTLATLAVYEARRVEALWELVRAVGQKTENTEGIPGPIDRPRFQSVALQELRNLNEGTFARYGLRPSEFER